MDNDVDDLREYIASMKRIVLYHFYQCINNQQDYSRDDTCFHLLHILYIVYIMKTTMGVVFMEELVSRELYLNTLPISCLSYAEWLKVKSVNDINGRQ